MAGTYKAPENADFIEGDSPETVDINTALSGRDATTVVVFNDGPGDFFISMSIDGETYGEQHRMKQGERITAQSVQTDSIRITWIADSSWRMVYG